MVLFVLPIFFVYGAKPQYLTIKNNSATSYSRAQIRIPLEKPPNGSYQFIEEGADASSSSIQSSVSISSQENILLLNTPLKSEETKVFQIRERKNSVPSIIPISTEAGTLHHFVNYENAYIISCEDENHIEVLTDNKKLLETFVLQKGKMYTYTSLNPTNILVQSKKPIFVYASSLSLDPLTNKEAEDSDTTTLFGDHLFFYHPGHLWLSSYQKDTIVKILDEDQLQVKNITIQPNQGIFIDDLPPGAYSILASSPITAQFGYLDNENFSYVLGNSADVNGFCFGDLLFYSPFDNADIRLLYKDKKETISLQNAGESTLVSLIQSYTPSLPEYVYFTASSNVPFYVLTFSSGKNFGGEFSPGRYGAYLDKVFTLLSSKISKEFSKDQKSLIELYSQYPHTKVEISTLDPSNDQNVTLDEYAIYNYFSTVPLEKINISSDNSILCLQLHNYTNKGLFYYVPPIENSQLTYSFHTSPSNEGALFANPSDGNFHYSMFFSVDRWRSFSHQIFNPDLLIFTIFFGGLIVLFLILALLLILKKHPISMPLVESQSIIPPCSPLSPESLDSTEMNDEEDFSSVQSVRKYPHANDSIETPQINATVNLSEKSQQESEITPPTSNEIDPSEESTQETTKKRIRLDPAHKPKWLNPNPKESKEDKSKPEEQTEESLNSTTNSSPQKHRKGIRISEPTIENIDFQNEIPSLHLDEEKIFSEIHRTNQKKQDNSLSDEKVKPSSTLDPVTQNHPDEVLTSKNTLKKNLSDTCKEDDDHSTSSVKKEMIQKIYQEPVSEKHSKETMVSNFENLFYTSVVFDPGAANRLFIEGYLQNFTKGFISSISSKKLNPAVVSHIKTVKLNSNDIAKANTMSDVCDTFEEAGRAFALCKKKRIRFYITSYRLPKILQGITVYSVHDIVKRFQSKDD
ncbi:MAG TPA: hypothetical protein PLE09_00180 [Caldisericia bacterium]|nr:hypothetical protein [Caldisericia bacterium]